MLKTYKIYYRFIFRYKLWFVLFAVSLVALSVLESIQPYFFRLVIDLVPTGDWRLLLNVLFVYVAVRFGKLAADLATYYFGDKVLLPAARDARLAVFRQIQELDFAYHINKSTGSMISAIKRGDGAFFEFWHAINVNATRAVIGFIVMVVMIGVVQKEIMLILLFGMGSILFFAYFLLKYNLVTRRIFNKSEDDISAVIVDNLINYETVKLFAKENAEYKRLKHKFKHWIWALWKFANSFRLIDLTVGIIGNLTFLAAVLLGWYELKNGMITTGEYVMILGFISAFYYRMFDFIYNLRKLAKFHADLTKYFDVFNYQTLVKDPLRPEKLKQVKGEIVFNQVSFSYPEGKEHALHDVSLDIPAGQSVALVGHSGAGKTTLVKLLLRFYDPDKGQILFDGTDIRRFKKSYLRSLMGVVPQDPILFNETIAYNIGYAADTTDLEKIKEAAKLANLDKFISSLPNGYQTIVGERGVKLSGGQKQRLAIARMILANPKVIIFDEATSQLDSESERLIQDALLKVSKDKTVIIIAHRLSTIVWVDKIVVMEDGKVAEVGKHHELIEKDGLYAKFWKLQTEEREEVYTSF